MPSPTYGNLTLVRGGREPWPQNVIGARTVRGLRLGACLAGLTLAASTCGRSHGTGANPEAEPDEATAAVAPAKPVPWTEAQAETRYAEIRTRFDAQPQLATSDAFPGVAADLRRLTNEASDVHLRANAALVLGALHEERGELASAIDFYRHASALVSDDAGPAMALALALAAHGQLDAAQGVQSRVVELDPDNLENWLILGELRTRLSDAAAAAEAYVGYERRRKGLIDGLTLGHDGQYRVSVEERVGCAEALASASDEGTAVALMYALKSDPEPDVRATVAAVMGVQRLSVYHQGLAAQLRSEQDPGVKHAIAAALAEVTRDPVAPQPLPSAVAPPGSQPPAGGVPAAKADADVPPH